MSRPRSRNNVVCQNRVCDYYRKVNGKDIIRRGFNNAGTQMYACQHCGKYFVETSGTPMYRKRLPLKTIKTMCRTLVEKNGIRATARITKLAINTVANWHDILASHAKETNEILTKNLGLSEYEVDEFWTTVKKNRKNTAALLNTSRVKGKPGASRASNEYRTSSLPSHSAVGRTKPVRS